MSHILIVDDDPEIRAVLQEYIEGLGYATDALPDGASALAWLEDHDTTMMLLDLLLPGQSGIDVLETLRRDRPEIPVIALSGCDDEDMARSALSLGAYDFLAKPVDLDALEVRILLGTSMPEPAGPR